MTKIETISTRIVPTTISLIYLKSRQLKKSIGGYRYLTILTIFSYVYMITGFTGEKVIVFFSKNETNLILNRKFIVQFDT